MENCQRGNSMCKELELNRSADRIFCLRKITGCNVENVLKRGQNWRQGEQEVEKTKKDELVQSQWSWKVIDELEKFKQWAGIGSHRLEGIVVKDVQELGFCF